jgi:hypothetical protein
MEVAAGLEDTAIVMVMETPVDLAGEEVIQAEEEEEEEETEGVEAAAPKPACLSYRFHVRLVFPWDCASSPIPKYEVLVYVDV